MKRFVDAGHPEGQPWLIPPSIDDFVPVNSPVRHLASILDELNVESFREAYAGGGRPAYDPIGLVRVIIFGMMNGVRSSRRLAESLRFDLRYKFLASMAEPDFRTIARFRANNEERIRDLFKETVKLGCVAELIDLGHVSVDGTRLEARASRSRYRSGAELDKLIAKADAVAQSLLAEWERNDDTDGDEDDPPSSPPPAVINAQEVKKRLEKAREEIARREANGIVVTDPECRMMKTGGGVRPGYNAQIVVDSKRQMIVAAEITQDEADNLQFKPMIEATARNTGKHPDKASADGGYWSAGTLKYVEDEKLDAYIAPSGLQPRSLTAWKYDEKTDAYTGPDGDLYQFEKQRRKGKAKAIYRIYRCKRTGRAKWIQVGRPYFTAMQKKTSTPEGAEVYRWRKVIVEPVFAHFKVAYGFRRLLTFGLTGAKTEHMIACITHNISKIMLSRTSTAPTS